MCKHDELTLGLSLAANTACLLMLDRWSRSGGLLSRGSLPPSTKEHAGNAMTNSRTNCHGTGSRRHLCKEARLARRASGSGGSRRRCRCRCVGVAVGRCGSCRGTASLSGCRRRRSTRSSGSTRTRLTL